MTKTQQESTDQEAPLTPPPLADVLNLLDGESVGYCSGDVCHITTPKAQ